ncbi:MAG: metallophosphoesterase [Candidatus Marinimicrobia bacterium]|nr:metallophosphoesterase [Candidatus Neomarinimicrobiota bacterium]
MIRILFFSDTHLGFDYPLRPRLERRRRGLDFFKNFRRVLQRATELKTDLIIHGGDLFFRSKIPDRIIEITYRPLIDTVAGGIPICIVPGNHELARLRDQSVLEQGEICVFDRPRTFCFSKNGASISVTGIPFIRNNVSGKIRALLKTARQGIKSADITICCLHQAVAGAQVGRQNFTFRKGPDVIGLTDLPPDFQIYLSGHIHRYQQLKTGAGIPVLFCGSTERTSIAEQKEEKGFCWLEFDKVAPNDWQLKIIRFEALPTRPMHEIKIPEQLTAVGEITAWLRSAGEELHPDSIVRVVFSNLDQTDRSAWISAAEIRSLFPASMTVEVKHNSYRSPKKIERLRLFEYDLDTRRYFNSGDAK